MNKENRLVEAYEQMLKRVHEWLAESGDEAHPLQSRLKQGLSTAREKAVELGELTREEADEVTRYLVRDLEDAGKYMERTKEELGPWLRFDIQLVESGVREAFAETADPTTLEQIQLNHQLEEMTQYHTGEITGLGTLRCVQCGELLHFHRPGRIPPCSKCQGTIFQRITAEDDVE